MFKAFLIDSYMIDNLSINLIFRIVLKKSAKTDYRVK